MESLSERILEESGEITNHAFKQAISIVDRQHGHGYAVKNPQLVTALINFQAQAFITLLNHNLTQNS
jgi:hypothetical protein